MKEMEKFIIILIYSLRIKKSKDIQYVFKLVG